MNDQTPRAAEAEQVCHEFIDTGSCRHSDAEHDAIADGHHLNRPGVSGGVS